MVAVILEALCSRSHAGTKYSKESLNLVWEIPTEEVQRGFRNKGVKLVYRARWTGAPDTLQLILGDFSTIINIWSKWAQLCTTKAQEIEGFRRLK